MDEEELPVVELELHDGDPLQLAAELTMANKRIAELEAAVASIGGAVQNAETALAQLEADEDRDDCRMVLHRARCAVEHERKLAATQDRWDRIGEIRMDCAHYGPALEEASECVRIQTERVAELEAENERLRAALMPLETSSLAYVVQEAAAATMQRDQLQAVLEQERRAVEALAEQCASQKPQRMPWMGCPVPAPDGYPGCLLGGRRPDCARCWAEWARKRAREDGGDIARVSDRWAREWVHGVFEGRWAALGLLAKRAREREREEAVKGDEPDGERNA